jgi:ribonuclease HI
VAEVGSNNTGELTAIAAALSWLLKEDPTRRPAIICYDSKYAADSVEGLFNGKRNEQLIQYTRSLYTLVSLGCPLALQHVKGHSNNQWNDMADHLAKLGNKGLSHISHPAQSHSGITLRNLTKKDRDTSINRDSIDENAYPALDIHTLPAMAEDAPT